MIEIMSGHWLHCFDGAPERALDEGEPLFRREAQVEGAFLVRQGQVSLRRALQDGGVLTLHSASAGDLIAEASLFAEHYHCEAVADVKTTVAVLPKWELLKQLEHNSSGSQLSVHAFERTSKELQTLRTRIEIMRLRKVKDRLDAYLELFGPPEEGGWVRVADWIGVSPPALYRELAKRRWSNPTEA